MTLKRLAYVGGSIFLVLFAASVLFLGNQRLAFADVPVHPCDIFDQMPPGFPPGPCNEDGGSEDEDCESGQHWDDETEQCVPDTPQCDDGETLNDNNECVPENPEPPTGGGDDDDNGDGSTPPSSTITGGGSSGGGGSSVLGAATAPTLSCTYLTSFIKPGGNNDSEQVYRLQALLKTFESANVEVNGVYDEASIAAVHAFQTKYASEILAPWGINQSTGFVYLTTRKKMNEIYCDRDLTFPLSAEEEQIIEKAKTAPVVTRPTVSAPAQPEELEEPETVEGRVEEAPVVDAPASSFTEFFRRLFDRFR